MRKLTKKSVRDFFDDKISGNWDVNLYGIVKTLGVTKQSVPKLQQILEKLEGGDWIVKNPCEHGTCEFDQEKAQGVWS